MKLLKGLAGSLLWILAGVLGLVSILLCVTIILLPLGIPLLGLSRRLMTTGVQLMLPKAVAHPVARSPSADFAAGVTRSRTPRATPRTALRRRARRARRAPRH